MRIAPPLADKIRAISVLCSLLVCFNHAYTVPATYAEIAHEAFALPVTLLENTWKYGFARISTPFFFLVAGFMLFRALLPEGVGALDAGRWREAVRKRTTSLLAPFLVISAWSFLVMAAAQSVPGLGGRAADPLLARSWQGIAEVLLWNPVAHPLWFLRNLFLLCLAAPLIALVFRSRTATVAAFALAAAAWCAWPEIRATRSILFFSLGGWLALHPLRLPAPGAGLRVALLVAWLAVAGTQALLIARTDAIDPLMNNLAILLGLSAVWFGYESVERLGRSAAVQRAAAFTLFIYLLHEPFATLARKAAQSVFTGPDRQPWLFAAWIGIGSALFLGLLAAGMLLSRYLPRVYAVVAGGRLPPPAPARPAGEAPALAGRGPVLVEG